MSDNRARCAHCGEPRPLDGNVMARHDTTVLKATGRVAVRCSGSGKPPLPKR